MEKNIIQVNQEILRTILSDAAQTALDEVGHKDGENICVEVNEDSLRLLSQFLKDNLGEGFILTFGREEPDCTYSEIIFSFEKVRLWTDKRFVIEGTADVSRHTKPIKYRIDYKFDKQCFYEAVCCANGTVRDKRNIELDYAGDHGTNNVRTAKDLIRLMTKWLYLDGNID